jgi:hypothetical protein
MINNEFKVYKEYLKPSVQKHLPQIDRMRALQGNKGSPIPFIEVFKIFHAFGINKQEAKDILNQLQINDIIKIIPFKGVILK